MNKNNETETEGTMDDICGNSKKGGIHICFERSEKPVSERVPGTRQHWLAWNVLHFVIQVLCFGTLALQVTLGFFGVC